jgi:drug/metabolite transporter (DMT)-like permease
VVALVGDGQDDPSARAHDGDSLARVLFATVAAGIGNLLYKVGLSAGSPPETLLVAQSWVFASLATLVVWLADGSIRPPRAALPHGALVGVTLLAAFVALLHALAVGPASVLVPVAQLGFVFTALLGRVLFAEPLSWRKRGGLAVAAAAIVTLALS